MKFPLMPCLRIVVGIMLQIHRVTAPHSSAQILRLQSGSSQRHGNFELAVTFSDAIRQCLLPVDF
jgi:hypothetical protein